MTASPSGALRMYLSADAAATEAIGARLAEELPADSILLLEGELGSGKTCLVRGLARALGVDPREVQSPTYTLMHEHTGTRGPLVHADLYRLAPEELDAIGLEEALAGPGWKAIEWPDRLAMLPVGAYRIMLREVADGRREIRVEGPNSESSSVG
ncbi:MAG: tRNA (adenosine(37)-N6)-threonylcarbamoyltransferase complex ATPase subunit type 1 TsaE [Acidobacteriota bacterium]